MGSAWVNCQLKEQGCFSRRFSPTFCASPALVAQWIEQRFPKPCVAGSIPAGGTILVSCFVACRREDTEPGFATPSKAPASHCPCSIKEMVYAPPTDSSGAHSKISCNQISSG